MPEATANCPSTSSSPADNALRYKWSEAYEERFPDYFRLNGRITFRLNRKSFDHEWGLDLQNMTNRENIFVQNWDNNKKEVATLPDGIYANDDLQDLFLIKIFPKFVQGFYFLCYRFRYFLVIDQ
jgi:hypothetical protein